MFSLLIVGVICQDPLWERACSRTMEFASKLAPTQGADPTPRRKSSWRTSTSRAAIVVIKTNNIVFPEVIAALHFDHHAINLAGVGETVGSAGGNVGRLVRAEGDFVLAVHYLGGARNHHPVLAAPVMILQRKRGTGLDHDTLDLEARPLLQ